MVTVVVQEELHVEVAVEAAAAVAVEAAAPVEVEAEAEAAVSDVVLGARDFLEAKLLAASPPWVNQCRYISQLPPLRLIDSAAS